MLFVAHFLEQRIVGRPGPNRLHPAGYVLLLVDAFSLGADLDVGDRLQPLVLQPQLDEIPRFRPCCGAARGMSSRRPREDIGIAVIEVLVVPEEVVDDKLPLVDMRCRARATASHLLVENWASHPPAEHEVEDLAAVEAGVEHADAHRDHGEGLGLEPANQGVRVGHVGGDDLGVAALVFGVQLVQILRQSRRVVLGDGEDDPLARARVLAGRQFRIALPGKPVELLHHQAVGLFVGPGAFELDGVVVLVVEIGPLGDDLGDARGEAVGYEVFLVEGVLY